MDTKNKKPNKGATMIEYALIAGLIAIVAISALRSVGNQLNTKMQYIADELNK